MTQVFLTSASTSPWTRPGDWADPGHTIDLVGCGGNGANGTVASAASGSGGGGGGYLKLTFSSGNLGATTAFAVKASNASTADQNTSATFWEGTTTTNTYEAQCGNAGLNTATNAAGGTGVTNGSPSPVTYTTATNAGGTGGAIGSVSAGRGGGGGGGGGGPTGAGKTGGLSANANPGGGGGGGGANNGAVGAAASGATGGAGGNGKGGSGGGAAGIPGGSGTLGGGGGGGTASATIGANNAGGSATTGDAVFDATHGGGGGGGGGGSNSASTGTAHCDGGSGSSFGGGGGGGAHGASASDTVAGGGGAGGLIGITYTAAVPNNPSRTQALAEIVSLNQLPAWPYLFIGESGQPYDGRVKLTPATAVVVVNEPPYTYGGPYWKQQEAASIAQPSPWVYDLLGAQEGTQPYGARKLAPQITAVQVNNPTPNLDQSVNLGVIELFRLLRSLDLHLSRGPARRATLWAATAKPVLHRGPSR